MRIYKPKRVTRFNSIDDRNIYPKMEQKVENERGTENLLEVFNIFLI